MGLFSRICFSFHILAYCRNLLSDSGLKQVSFIGLFSNIWVSFDIFGVLQEAIERLQVGVGLFSHMWVSIHVYRSLFTCFVLQEAFERLRIGVGLFDRSFSPYTGLFSHMWVCFLHNWRTAGSH